MMPLVILIVIKFLAQINLLNSAEKQYYQIGWLTLEIPPVV